MPKYTVDVKVDFTFDVEADNQVQAEQMGWNWEDYKMYSTVYSIEAEEIEEDELV
jgi:hypothetical protein